MLVAETAAIRKMIAVALKRAGFQVECCDPAQAAPLLRRGRFRVLITNSCAQLPHHQMPTIYLAGDPLECTQPFPAYVRAISKPLEVAHLVASVRELLMVNTAPQRKSAEPIGVEEKSSLKAGH